MQPENSDMFSEEMDTAEESLKHSVEDVPAPESSVVAPESLAVNAITEIAEEVSGLIANARALEDLLIAENAGDTDAVAAEAEGDTMAKLRAISANAGVVARDSITRISGIIGTAEGSSRKTIDALIAAMLISISGNVPEDKVPKAPESPVLASAPAREANVHRQGDDWPTVLRARVPSEAINKVVPNKSWPIIESPLSLDASHVAEEVSQESSAVEELPRMIWHEARGGPAVIDAFSKLFSGLYPEKDIPIKLANITEVDKALDDLTNSITSYPPEFRKNVLHDRTLRTALEYLNMFRKISGDQTEGLPEGDKNALFAVAEKSIKLSYRIVDELHADMIQHAGLMPEKEHADGVTFIADTFNEHVENAILLTDAEDGPAVLNSVLRVADEAFQSFSGAMSGEMHLPNGALDPKAKLFPFLVQAGHAEATKIVVEKLASGEIKTSELKNLFDDKDRTFSTEAKELFGNPKYANVGNGGEVVSAQLLQTFQLPAESYLPIWSRPANQEIRNAAVYQNITNVIAIERHKQGGMSKLTENYGIRNPGRYPQELLLEQLEAKKDFLPYGAAISAVDDNNGAFVKVTRMDELYEQAKGQGLKLRVVEAGSQAETSRRLLDLVEASGKKMSYIGVRGHGSKDSTKMGQGESDVIDETFLGVGPDRTSLILEDGAAIYFESCSTGVEGGMAQKVSANVTGEVTAPDQDTFIDKLALTKDASGKVSFQVKYNDYGAPTKSRTYFQGKLVDEGRAIPRPNQRVYPDTRAGQ